MIALEDRERVLGALLAHVRGETAEFVVEYRLPAQADARARWRQARGTLVRDELGVPTHLVGTAHDITSARTAEQEAWRAMHQLTLATDLSGIGVWGYELDGGDLASARSSFDNDGVSASLGYDVDDVPANFPSRVRAAVFPEDAPRMLQLTQDCMAGRIWVRTSPRFRRSWTGRHANGSASCG